MEVATVRLEERGQSSQPALRRVEPHEAGERGDTTCWMPPLSFMHGALRTMLWQIVLSTGEGCPSAYVCPGAVEDPLH